MFVNLVVVSTGSKAEKIIMNMWVKLTVLDWMFLSTTAVLYCLYKRHSSEEGRGPPVIEKHILHAQIQPSILDQFQLQL